MQVRIEPQTVLKIKNGCRTQQNKFADLEYYLKWRTWEEDVETQEENETADAYFPEVFPGEPVGCSRAHWRSHLRLEAMRLLRTECWASRED